MTRGVFRLIRSASATLRPETLTELERVFEAPVTESYGLTEAIKTEGGYLKTKSLGEYMIPTSLDVPRIEPHIIEVPVSRGPYGAKGVGEPALIPTTPAILNAIADAIDVRVTELPASLENLHRLIREKEKDSK